MTSSRAGPWSCNGFLVGWSILAPRSPCRRRCIAPCAMRSFCMRVGTQKARPHRRLAMIAEPTLPPLTIRAVRSIGVEVPMTYALGTSQARITRAPLLLIDLETEEGVTGRTYLFCYLSAAAPAMAAMLDEIGRMVAGDRVAPAQLWSKLAQRFMLIGVQGVVRMAMAGLDVAAWDALALAAGVPLATFLDANVDKNLGTKPQPITAYNSCGLGLM